MGVHRGLRLDFLPFWGRRRTRNNTSEAATGTHFLLHVPKTAGSTIAAAVADAIGAEAVRVLDSDARAATYFADEYEEEMAAVRFVTAHCQKSRLPAGPCFTTLRQPVDRLISLFLHFRREPSIYPLDPASDLPAFFDGMMQLGPTEVSNTHCWYLSSETAEAAWDVLAQGIRAWAVTGKVERLIAEILRSLGTPGGPIEVRNASPLGGEAGAWRRGARPPSYDDFFAGLPASARARILDANSEDLKLWSLAIRKGGFGRQRR